MNFNDQRMHTTWLVHNASAFATNPGSTSERDQLLHLGLTYGEWKALYFDVLGVNQEDYKTLMQTKPDAAKNFFIGEFDQNDPALKRYPMLSRICGILYDAVFEANEIDELRQECMRVISITGNIEATRGIQKLLNICDHAQKLGLSVYFMSD